jgi:hypothetical protein
MMLSMLSSTDWMKQADDWGYSYWVAARSVWLVFRLKNQLPLSLVLPMAYWWKRPTLNQTGELKAPYWLTQSQVSSR